MDGILFQELMEQTRMLALRKTFEIFYDMVKPVIFSMTRKDPESAHELFVDFCRFLYETRLDKITLDNRSNKRVLPFRIANAAGSNKNADIPPQVLRYLGFDNAVIGTVTGDAWKGNPRPRIVRYPGSESLVNWMGLPGIGASAVADRLYLYGKHGVPLIINIMATPGKKDDFVLSDLQKSILATRDLPYVFRYELNISCPNTHAASGEMDARKEYARNLESTVQVVNESKLYNQEIGLKVSPDLDELGIDAILEVCRRKEVKWITTTNTTTFHDSDYIFLSPGKGGASGDALWKRSLNVQKSFYRKIKDAGLNISLVGCGGIKNLASVQERLAYGAEEIQIFTPFIYRGPKLLRELRTARYANI